MQAHELIRKAAKEVCDREWATRELAVVVRTWLVVGGWSDERIAALTFGDVTEFVLARPRLGVRILSALHEYPDVRLRVTEDARCRLQRAAQGLPVDPDTWYMYQTPGG